jgi:hypothetical protein
MNIIAEIGSSNKNILLVVFLKIISAPDITIISIKITRSRSEITSKPIQRV